MSASDPSGGALPQLAARAQLGDRSALEALLRGLAGQLGPWIEQLTGDRDQADDVLQEVLLRVAQKLPGLREHAWVRAWAYRIATREALRHVARARRSAPLPLDEAADVPVPESPADDVAYDPETLARLPSLVATLPAAAQVVIRLHYLHGLTQPEVAAALSIPLGTVKSRLAYGLRQLRSRMLAASDSAP